MPNVIITQHGKGVAVLLGVSEYEAMQDKPSAAEKWINTIFSKVEQLQFSIFTIRHGRQILQPLSVKRVKTDSKVSTA
ncbi:type II toxin-antitoxin system prevent-host-death family antitoxin [Desulfobacula phenolica]|uniref:type II toxin-antitoxin system prevent-host-death family antitoxin n=1 Tax=Desulfobacula phenolica TaxID=90732 RepID=UPI000B82318C|nr:type II toxin-antitoxin system prevent-host-death family antitoxin [Desulfobacula phenolica]